MTVEEASGAAHETVAHNRMEAQRTAFEALARAYRAAWGLTCVLADTDGTVVAGGDAPGEDRAPECAGATGCALAADCAASRRRVIEEAVRWGEPSVLLCPHENLLWAVPVMENARVLGGVVASRADIASLHPTGGHPAVPHAAGPHAVGAHRPAGPDNRPGLKEMRQAVSDLLVRAVEGNLTNGAFLALQRTSAARENERAKAIHELKDQRYESIREIYLTEEPALIAAIKQGDRPQARGIINRVLLGIYYMGRDRPQLLKSFLLELVVMMSRSAVEAGADPSELLGTNFSSLSMLANIDDEEALSAWLVAMLERIMDAIRANQHYPIGVMIGRAMRYMQEHLPEDLSRDDVAAVACLSPSHFSRVVKQTYGQSFTELLTQMRVERAREMLVRTEKSLFQVCMDCGFSDQSYFTKVFQKHTGHPPGEYRRLNRGLP